MKRKIKEIWKPIVVSGKQHFWYSVSNFGNVVSHLRKSSGFGRKFEYIFYPTYKKQMRPITDARGALRVELTFPKDFFEGTSNQNIDYRSKSVGKMVKKIYIHQLVMWAFKPIDLYPPPRLKPIWENIPKEAKLWIEETIVINHIDHNPKNNRIDNLEYVTPCENTNKAKKFYDGIFVKKEKFELIQIEKSEPNALEQLLGI